MEGKSLKAIGSAKDGGVEGKIKLWLKGA